MKKLFMAVIALMMTISASAQFYIYCSDGNVIKVDSISIVAPTESDAPDEPDGPIIPDEPATPSAGIGTFSVSADKQVTFSPGNLQYHPANNKWRFAPSQLDYIGDANSNCSPTYNGWLDFFGWGTGNNPTNLSTDYNDYQTFVDWGTNQIGSDAPNTWRTLTHDEWEYLLNTRTNASSLKGVAQVNGVNGLILLPDNWVCPAGVTFKSGFHSNYGEDYYAEYQIFTAEQWFKLEAAGAVFLPAAGFRRDSYVYSVQGGGYYWSATESDSRRAYFLCFIPVEAYMYGEDRDYGPSVRLVKDIEGGGTTPDTPTNTENGYEYVDLGLSVKWATCNVGASKPEESGDYFAWGETQPKDYYERSTYKWCNGSIHSHTKYCIDSFWGTIDNKTVLEAADDAATANWGGSWRMPTDAELTELITECTWTWTTENGVNGHKVTSKSNGNSIFLPAAGIRRYSSLYDAGGDGSYWSSSLDRGNSSSAYELDFNSSNVRRAFDCDRTHGRSVRPVCQ